MTLVLGGFVVAFMVGMLYYVLEVLTTFRKGMLEPGWKSLALGSLVAIIGQLLVTLSIYKPFDGYLFQLGTGIDIIGAYLFVKGFKSHHDVWHEKDRRREPVPVIPESS